MAKNERTLRFNGNCFCFFFFFCSLTKYTIAMSNGKQPLEGLTVRIWDPPSTTESKKTADENLLKGNRGFRQYTEQIGNLNPPSICSWSNRVISIYETPGSDKLKYTTHDWDTEEKKGNPLFLHTQLSFKHIVFFFQLIVQDWNNPLVTGMLKKRKRSLFKSCLF